MKSNCRPRPPGARRSRPPSRSHAECLVPCSQTIRSALALNLCCIEGTTGVISTHLKLQQAPLPKKTITHTHRQQHQTHSLGEMRWSTAKSPSLPSFSHFRAGLAEVSLLPAYQNPLPPLHHLAHYRWLESSINVLYPFGQLMLPVFCVLFIQQIFTEHTLCSKKFKEVLAIQVWLA